MSMNKKNIIITILLFLLFPMVVNANQCIISVKDATKSEPYDDVNKNINNYYYEITIVPGEAIDKTISISFDKNADCPSDGKWSLDENTAKLEKDDLLFQIGYDCSLNGGTLSCKISSSSAPNYYHTKGVTNGIMVLYLPNDESAGSEASSAAILYFDFVENSQSVVATSNEQPQQTTSHISASKFCTDDGVKKSLRFIGYLLLVVKIFVPLIIIVIGSFDFYKSVTSGKDEDLKKDITRLGRRVVTGIIIFFIPTIVNFLLSTVASWSGDHTRYTSCTSCLFNPTSCSVNDTN